MHHCVLSQKKCITVAACMHDKLHEVARTCACMHANLHVLASSAEESPVKPLRLWLVGYAVQCLVHVGLVCAAPAVQLFFVILLSRCETMNTLISFLWWIIGFYWLVSGGVVLEYGAPRLYWYDTFILLAS